MAVTFEPLSISLPLDVSSNSTSGIFAASQAVPDMGSSQLSPKRHFACDECRARKLRCSGESSDCSRCIKNDLACHYSEQKQMGRPRKRQKTNEDPVPQQSLPTSNEKQSQLIESQLNSLDFPAFPDDDESLQHAVPSIDPLLAASEQAETRFNNVCTGPIAQTIRDHAGHTTLQEQVSQYQDTYASDVVPQYPLDIAEWPDYSNFDTLPAPFHSDTASTSDTYIPSLSHQVSNDSPHTFVNDPDTNPALLATLPASPSCPCLANLYLTLSTLSTLSAFPISNHTISTLIAAHRTARDVIYCAVCPRKFQTGSQNLMLSCTLLNVLADQWHKVKGAKSEDLKKGFSSNETISTSSFPFISTKEGQQWRDFASNLIRAYVFGDQPVPAPPQTPHPTSSQVPTEHTLLHIIESLARRQRQWHNFDEPTEEFPDRCSEGYTYHMHRHDKMKKIESRIASDPHPGHCKVHGTSHATSTEEASRNGNKEETETGERTFDADHAVCLMIIKYSRDIVNSLDS